MFVKWCSWESRLVRWVWRVPIDHCKTRTNQTHNLLHNVFLKIFYWHRHLYFTVMMRERDLNHSWLHTWHACKPLMHTCTPNLVPFIWDLSGSAVFFNNRYLQKQCQKCTKALYTLKLQTENEILQTLSHAEIMLCIFDVHCHSVFKHSARLTHTHTQHRHTSCCRDVSPQQWGEYLICFTPTDGICCDECMHGYTQTHTHGRINTSVSSDAQIWFL